MHDTDMLRRQVLADRYRNGFSRCIRSHIAIESEQQADLMRVAGITHNILMVRPNRQPTDSQLSQLVS